MFGGMGGRNRDQNIGSWWQNLQLAYKTLLVVSLATVFLSIFLGSFIMYLPNMVQKTVSNFQIWRLLTSFLVNGTGINGFINVLFFYYMLNFTLPDLERKYSTAYVVFEVLLQTFLCNLTIVCIGYPLIYFGIVAASQFVGYGVIHLVLILMFQRAANNPQEPTRFCFFPCLIPMKYTPWCYLLLIVLFGNSIVTSGIYGLIGYYQYIVNKKAILQLPLSVYRKFDYLMPDSIKAKLGYVKVASVQGQLKLVCKQRNCFYSSEEQRNPFDSNINGMMNDHVQVIGSGIQIGANSQPRQPVDFRSHWQKHENEKQQEVSAQSIQKQQNDTSNKLQDTSTNLIREHTLQNSLEQDSKK